MRVRQNFITEIYSNNLNIMCIDSNIVS